MTVGDVAEAEPVTSEPVTTEVMVGRIGRPHGLRGDVTVEVRTDEPERRFAVGNRLRADGTDRWFTVAHTAWHQGRLLVGFDEIADRTAAEAARDLLLVLPVPADETPDDGSFYDRQLVGLRVLAADGTVVGQVTEVVHLPAQDLLAVRLSSAPAGSDPVRLVPFVTALVPVVDVAAGLLQLAEVPGLLDDLD